MRRANPWRRAILGIIRDEQTARPGCALVSSMGVDEDGRPYVHFTCLSHDQATWRYYVHVYVDTELAQAFNPGPELHSRCPAVRAGRVAFREAIPKEDSPAEAPEHTVDCSGEELVEVEDEVS